MSQKTVTVKGVVYDQRTGKLLRVERGNETTRAHAAQVVHTPLQKSRTLHRKYVHKSAAVEKKAVATQNPTPIVVRRQPTHQPTPAHTLVRRFATTPPHHAAHPPSASMDIMPAPHQLAHKVSLRTTKAVQNPVKPSHILKREAIEKATAAMPATRAKRVAVSEVSRARRALSVASSAIALLLLGGYITYLNMPALSTKVAAAQAGIGATYPAYQPSGYSLSGPVAYQQGNVTIKFAANAGPEGYTLSQTKSGWDSSAVLENYVSPKVGDNYMTNSVNGLTIYTYGPNAAWVNDGILYTVSGDAPLSTDQVERIATSI